MRSALTIASISLALIASSCSAGQAVSATVVRATPTAGSPSPGDDTIDNDQQVDASSAPTVTARPTASAPTTPTAPDTTPAPSLTPDNTCSRGLVGSPSTTASTTADFDGDGARDQVTVYDTGDPSDPWHIRVDTASGASLDSTMGPGVTATADVRPIGGADVDGDGATDELFVVIGAGASTIIVGVYSRSGCDIVQVMLDGSPLGFPIGGSIGNIAGLECVNPEGGRVNGTIVAWTGLADFDSGEGRYLVEGIEYRLRGAELERIGTQAFEASTDQADFVYGQLSCPPVNL